MPDRDQGSENDTSGLFKSSLVKYFFSTGNPDKKYLQNKNVWMLQFFWKFMQGKKIQQKIKNLEMTKQIL